MTVTYPNWRHARMGNIGEPVRYIEFEPMPETAPAAEPAPSEPEKVPA
jgi:hypothetical protein